MKMWGDKRYYSLNYFLRQKFGEKVFKISLDAGFSCPNRDGRISNGGCIFCSARGSGDFAGCGDDLVKQFNDIKDMMNKNGRKECTFHISKPTLTLMHLLKYLKKNITAY